MTDTLDASRKSLISAMDETALDLLKKIRTDANVRKQDDPDQTDILIEQVKAFEAVTNYVKVREGVAPPAPPPKPESQFDKLKRNFNGEGSSRRRNSRAAPPPPDSDDEPDDGDDEQLGS